MTKLEQTQDEKTAQQYRSALAPSSGTQSGPARSPSHAIAMPAEPPPLLVGTITTIQSLLTCNGSARPVTVELTPNELRLIAAAPDMLAALKELMDIAPARDMDADVILAAYGAARAAIAKATTGAQ